MLVVVTVAILAQATSNLGPCRLTPNEWISTLFNWSFARDH